MSPHPEDNLSAYLDGELSPRERSDVEAHLRGCQDCARRLSEMAAADSALREQPASAPPGYFEAFPARFRARLDKAARPGSRRMPLWLGAAAAAILLAVIVPLTIRQTAPTLAPPPERWSDLQAALPAPPATPVPEQKMAGRRPEAAPARDLAVPSPAPAAPRPRGELRKQAPSAPPAEAEGQVLDETTADASPLHESLGRSSAPAVPAEQEADAKSLRAAARMRAPAGEYRAYGLQAEDSFGSLAARSPETAEEARSLREAWRAYAHANPQGPRADEAWVRVVEAGLAAWRLGRHPGDRERAREDAAAYLSRKDATRADRVRAALEALKD